MSQVHCLKLEDGESWKVIIIIIIIIINNKCLQGAHCCVQPI